MPIIMNLETSARLKALFAALVWGGSFVATKAALRDIQPITLIVLRFAIGILILAFAVWRLRVFRIVATRDFILLAFLGFIAIVVHQGLQAFGLLFTTSGNMAWLVATQPIFTAILAAMVLREIFGAIKIAGLVIAFVGVILVVTRGALSPETLRLPSTFGDLLALASALNWTIFSVISKPILKRISPTLMMAYVMTIGWLIVVPVWGIGQGWNDLAHLTRDGWIAVAFLGIFCSGIAYIFWYDALAHIDASQVAAFIYLEPLVTMIVAAIILSEPITPITLLGGFTIILGVYLVNRPTRRAEAIVARD
ncbi:MAG: DMT family transporter [Chloroflexi bacterium]|nr:DMT family transporter [Chloroflexota bacterium]